MARTSVLTGGTNSAQTTSEDLNAVATDLIAADGVIGTLTNTSGVAPMTGGLALNAQGSPNTTTALTAGTVYITVTPTSQASQRVRVKVDAQNVTHSANSTGGTRYDWVYVSLDATKAANPNSSMSDVYTVVTSRSTSNATDNGTPPTYGYCVAVVTLANGFSSVTNGNIADSRVQAGMTATAKSVTSGLPIQVADTIVSTSATGTTQIPVDDTIPQNTEGDQYMTLSFTPKLSTSKLYIDVIANLSSSAANNMVLALFKDSDAGALAAVVETNDSIAGYYPMKLGYSYSPGSTTAITFKVRAGAGGAGTTTFNGAGGARKMGGIMSSYIRVTEVHG